MLIEDISTSQVITAILFIASLLAVQLYISKNKNSLKGKWASNRRIRLADTTRLGPTEKVQIVQVDNSEYLYFFSKGNQPVIVPMVKHSKSTSEATNNMDIRQPSPTNIKSTLNKTRMKSNDVKESESDHKIRQAISVARKKNPKVSFE